MVSHQDNAWERFCAHYKCTVSFESADKVSFSYRGYEFHAQCNRVGKHKGLWFSVLPTSSSLYPATYIPLSERATEKPLRADAVPMMVFTKESFWTRFGAWARLDRELQVGDEHFDRAVYIETNVQSDVMHPLCMQTAFRGAVLSLLTMGFKRVEVFTAKHPLHISWSNHDNAILEPVLAQNILDAMVDIVEALPPLRVKNPTKTSLRARDRVFAWSILTPVLCVVGLLFSGCMWEPIFFASLWSAGIAGVLFWCFGLVALVRYLSRYSGGFRVLGAYLTGGLVGAVMLTCVLYLTANGLLDISTPIPHRAQVQDRWVSKGKSTSYHIRYSFVHDGERVLRKSQVSSDLYRGLRKGSEVHVFVSRGLFRNPWIAAVSRTEVQEVGLWERWEYAFSL